MLKVLDPKLCDLAMSRLQTESFLLKGRTRICCKRLGRLVARGEMLIEHRDSWFSTKLI